MEPQVLPPPRKPGRWTWAVAGRLCRRAALGLPLALLVAFVAWPERPRGECLNCRVLSAIEDVHQRPRSYRSSPLYNEDEVRAVVLTQPCERDNASLDVLVDALTE